MPKNSVKQADITKIKSYPGSLIREHESDDGSTFTTLSFRYNDDWASLVLSDDAIFQSTNRNGNIIEGRFDIMLGAPEEVQNVSIREGENYRYQPMFNRTILSSILASRQEYLHSIAV